MSTYVDLILDRVELNALIYTIAWCVNVMVPCTDSLEIILNVTLRQKQRIEHLVVFSLAYYLKAVINL